MLESLLRLTKENNFGMKISSCGFVAATYLLAFRMSYHLVSLSNSRLINFCLSLDILDQLRTVFQLLICTPSLGIVSYRYSYLLYTIDASVLLENNHDIFSISLLWLFALNLYNKKRITRWLEDINFIFLW